MRSLLARNTEKRRCAGGRQPPDAQIVSNHDIPGLRVARRSGSATSEGQTGPATSKWSWLGTALLLAVAEAAPAVAQTTAAPRPNEPPGWTAAIREVEVEPSVSVDGQTDKDEVERRQVRNLNRQGAIMLDAARQRADAIQRNYEEALARSRIEEKLYQDALAKRRAEMEAWERARREQVPR